MDADVAPNVLQPANTQYGLNSVRGVNGVELPRNANIYNKQGMFQGTLADIKQKSRNNVVVNVFGTTIGTFSDPAFQLYYNPNVQDLLSASNLKFRHDFLRDSVQKYGGANRRKTKRKSLKKRTLKKRTLKKRKCKRKSVKKRN